MGATTLLVSLHVNAQTAPSVVGAGGVPQNSDPNALQTRGFQLEYGADVGIGETDNVTLVRNDKVSQTIFTTDVDFDLRERSRRLDADAKGDFSYLNFLQGAYGSELLGRFDGVADVALIPERITWQFQDSFGQAQIDPFTAVTPTNRENVNYLSTGPDATLRFGPLFFMTASARYARVTYQTSPFDSNRLQASLGLGMQLSAASSVALDGSFERVLFDTTVLNNVPINSDFSRTQIFGHYSLTGARTELTVNLGATKVEQGAFSSTEPTARVRLLRKMSSASTLTLTAGRDVTDASTGFNTLQGGAIGTVGVAPAAQALTNYTATYANGVWQYQRNRTLVALSASWERDTYDGLSSLDTTREGAQLRLERRLTRALTAQLTGGVNRDVYPHPNVTLIGGQTTGSPPPSGGEYSQTLSQVGSSLIYRSARGVEIRLRYQHTSRVAGGIASGTGYDENRVFLTAGYHPGKFSRD